MRFRKYHQLIILVIPFPKMYSFTDIILTLKKPDVIYNNNNTQDISDQFALTVFYFKTCIKHYKNSQENNLICTDIYGYIISRTIIFRRSEFYSPGWLRHRKKVGIEKCNLINTFIKNQYWVWTPAQKWCGKTKVTRRQHISLVTFIRPKKIDSLSQHLLPK